MPISHKNGVAISGVSHILGISKASISELSGQSLGASSAFRFAWFTDLHFGRVGYGTGEFKDAFDYVGTNFSDVAFVVASGDISDNARSSEISDFLTAKSTSNLSGKTWYILPGNHDELVDVEADGAMGGTADYQYYDAAGLPRRWAFTYNGYRFIGFTSVLRRTPDPLAGFGDVSSTDLSFVASELDARGALIPFVFSHYPLADTVGHNIKGTAQSTLLTLLGDYNAYVYAHGHRHVDYRRDPDGASINHINGECLAYSVPNTIGSFMIVEVNGLSITVKTYLRTSPWTLRSTDTFFISLPDSTAPTVSSRTINSAGTQLTVVFSEVVKISTGGSGGMALTASGGAATLTYSSGSGTNTLVYTISRQIVAGETCSIAYTQPGNGIEDSAHNDLASFSGASVTNGSTYTGWDYYSAVFDGTNDYVERGAELTGISDGKTGTVSVWFKAASGAGGYILGTASQRFTVNVGSALIIEAMTTSGTTIMRMQVSTDYRDGAWHHLLASWDLAGTGRVYIDGADTSPWLQTFTNDTIDYTTGNWIVGTRGDSFGKFNGKLCEPFFDLVSRDISSSTVRANFRSGANKPVDLTGLNGLIYLNGQAPSSWNTNRGTGGAFSVVGTIDDGTTDRP